MTILLIYVAIFAGAFFAVRLVTSQLAKAHDFTSLKTVTFGDESAVTADRAASKKRSSSDRSAASSPG